MNDGQLGWLRSNRTRLLDSQMPIDNILDELVAKHVFYTNHDDYQIFSVQPTTSTKTRHLLDALPSKSPASFEVFVETLKKLCPHVVERCTAMPKPPKTRMGQLHEQLFRRLHVKKTRHHACHGLARSYRWSSCWNVLPRSCCCRPREAGQLQ